MISDKSKLVLLGAVFFGCLATFFTSSSRLLGARELATLKPQVQRFCKEPRSRAIQCLNKHDQSSCSSLLKQATKCEEALTSAFRHINMGGCPREIQMVSLCEVEWCEDADSKNAKEACQTECAAVRQALDECMKKHILSFFQRHGLEENGTMKLQ